MSVPLPPPVPDDLPPPTGLPVGVGPGQAEPSKPWWKRKRVLIPSGVLVIALIGSITSQGGGTPAPLAGAVASSSTSPSAVATTASTTPSASPEATPTPEETPTEEAPSYAGDYDGTFGTFAVLKKSGRGDAVVKLPAGLKGAVLVATHRGSSNFVIESLDSSNDSVDLLVNDIGRYTGTTFVGEGYNGSPTKLKIQADGRWTIEIKPVSKAPKMSEKSSGVGDAVLLYEMAAKDLMIKHKGKSNFVVNVVGNGDGLLVNEIGNYQGVVPIGEGPAVVVVTADGSWSVQAQ